MKIVNLKEVNSTNDYLRSHFAGDAEDMVVATAEYQNAGRGQGGNSWESEAGKNLLFSILIHPLTVPPSGQFVISMAISIAIRKALSVYIDDVSIKWPNDIYCGDKKICGILIENRLRGGKICDCILGIGVNINQRIFVSDAPNPVSLYQLLGRDIAPEEVLHRIIDLFGIYTREMSSGDYAVIRQEYKSLLYRRSGYFRYCDIGGGFEAELLDVADDGHLLLRDSQGKMRSYAFKEVKYLI